MRCDCEMWYESCSNQLIGIEWYFEYKLRCKFYNSWNIDAMFLTWCIKIGRDEWIELLKVSKSGNVDIKNISKFWFYTRI